MKKDESELIRVEFVGNAWGGQTGCWVDMEPVEQATSKKCLRVYFPEMTDENCNRIAKWAGRKHRKVGDQIMVSFA